MNLRNKALQCYLANAKQQREGNNPPEKHVIESFKAENTQKETSTLRKQKWKDAFYKENPQNVSKVNLI